MPDLPELANTNIEPEIQNPFSSSLDTKNTFQLIGESWKNFSGKQKTVFAAIMIMVFAIPISAGIISRQQSLQRSRAFTPTATPVTSPATPPPTPVSCIRQTPTFTVSPISQLASPGKTVTYRVSITNNDNSSVCNPWGFSLSVVLPNQSWLGSTTMPIRNFPVSAKTTISFDYTVTSPKVLKPVSGRYPIIFKLTSPITNYTSNQTVYYEVTGQTSTPRPPTKGIPIPSLSPVSQ